MDIVISKSGKAAKPFLDRIRLVKGNISAQDVDAILILLPQTLEFKGGINQSISNACGHDLDEFILENIYKPKIGDVYALPAFDLSAKHIFVGIAPHYKSEFEMQEKHLSSVIRKSMELARCMLLTSIAIPPVSSGKGGFPKAKAARLIVQGITDRLEESFEEVRIVCPTQEVGEVFYHKLKAVGWRQ